MLLLAGLSMLPDADVIGFALHVPYEAPFGHRGATHSLVFALAVALVSVAVACAVKLRPLRTGALVFAVVASHGLLDTLTDGGLGVALLWPFSDVRFFAPWRPIPVAPIGAAFFLTGYGLRVAATELVLFVPLWLYAFWPRRGGKGSPLVRSGA
jgi:inner membrane protein